MSARRRPRPSASRVLDQIIASGDRDAALAKLTHALAGAWNHGYNRGWEDGVNDATEDEPPPQHTNPYR